MKVTLNWLKQYVDFTWSPEELAERLTMLGLEVEGVQKLAGAFEGIVVAQVITRDKHPNADKLSLCRVNDGRGERQIVCGAQNFQAGDKVPLIFPGASLPLKPGEATPFTIKVGKIRGIESHGMMCSHEELGLDPEAIGHKKEEGLLILRPDAPVGQSFAGYLGRAGSDVVLDLEVTPNRPDLNSLLGIAREIAAVTGNPLKIPGVQSETRKTESLKLETSALVSVRIEAPDLCPRYTARVVKGVKVGPSPDWLRGTLEKVGIRSISNVVDVTNYVMMETGQPMHAFDYHLISGAAAGCDSNTQPVNPSLPTIIIRRAGAGEAFTTLDGQKRTLTGDTLLIADAQKGIALAGVMGGQNTEINNQTVDVLIESAYFNPTNIRRTSKQLGLRTESSYRFERGADIGIADWASLRCAQLIFETAGGQIAEGVVDAYPEPVKPKQITLRHQKVNDLLGITLPPEDMEACLSRLGLRITNRKPRPVDGPPVAEPVTFQIPTWRVDLKRETDLIEEIERLHGLDKIPATPPRGAIGSNAFDSVHDQIAEARRILAGLGLNEAQGQTLISTTAATLFGGGSPDNAPATTTPLVLLANPLSSDMSVLRPSLLPGLLHSLGHNLNRQTHDVALFEIGRVFTAVNGRPREERRMAIALTGQRQALFWSGEERHAKFDLPDLKGLLEEFLEQFGLRGLQYSRRADSTTTLLESATVSLAGRQLVGELGQLLPALARRHDLRDPVLLAELNLDLLLARRNPARSFKPLPAFPSVRRDVAMFVPEAVTHEAVLLVVKQAKAANLENVELFDVFRGKHVPEGQKSLAYAFTYRNAERTLTDAEVNATQEKLVADLKAKLGATVREC